MTPATLSGKAAKTESSASVGSLTLKKQLCFTSWNSSVTSHLLFKDGKISENAEAQLLCESPDLN